jgi:hypothetical protein
MRNCLLSIGLLSNSKLSGPNINSNKNNNVVDYYNYGAEPIPWVGGYYANTTIGPNNQTKEASDLYLQVHGDNNTANSYAYVSGYRTYVTDITVDLTGIGTLFVEWEGLGGDDSIDGGRFQILSVSKPADKSGYARSDTNQTLVYYDRPRGTDSLDVSGITGYWHIKVGCAAAWANRYQNLKVFRVWGTKTSSKVVELMADFINWKVSQNASKSTSTFLVQNNSSAKSFVQTTNKMSIGGFTKIYADIEITSKGTDVNAAACLYLNSTDLAGDQSSPVASTYDMSVGRTIISFDTTGMSGSYYLGIQFYQTNGVVYRIWGEQKEQPVIPAFTPGDNILCNVPSASYTGSTPTKRRTIKILNVGGTFRVKFLLCTENGSYTTAYAQIYKNGVAYGTQRSTASGQNVAFSEDLTFAANDEVQLYTWNSGAYHVNVQDFQVCVAQSVNNPSAYAIELTDKLVLYDAGNEEISNTGGWVPAYKRGQNTQSKDNSKLYLAIQAGGDDSSVSYATANKISFTANSGKRLYVDWIATCTGGLDMNLCVSSDPSTLSGLGDTARALIPSLNTRQITALNVGHLSGQYYIDVYVNGASAYSMTLTVYKIWIE